MTVRSVSQSPLFSSSSPDCPRAGGWSGRCGECRTPLSVLVAFLPTCFHFPFSPAKQVDHLCEPLCESDYIPVALPPCYPWYARLMLFTAWCWVVVVFPLNVQVSNMLPSVRWVDKSNDWSTGNISKWIDSVFGRAFSGVLWPSHWLTVKLLRRHDSSNPKQDGKPRQEIGNINGCQPI